MIFALWSVPILCCKVRVCIENLKVAVSRDMLVT